MIDDANSINILNHTIMSTKSFLHEVMSIDEELKEIKEEQVAKNEQIGNKGQKNAS